MSPDQYKIIANKISNQEPLLYCAQEIKSEDFDLYNLLNHQNCDKRIFLYFKKNDNNILGEEEFIKKFKQFPRNSKFSSPYEFDIHYSHYFEFDKYYENMSEFYYFFDYKGNRERLISFLNTILLNKLYFLFGKSGIGKSTMIIQVFKYDYNHMQKGTLYINCKTLYHNFKNNINVMKTILKDEVIFLFQNEYIKYKECVDMINKYIPDTFSTFWELIYKIISLCDNENKEYYIIFDQYKNKIDENGELFKINNQLKGKNKFSIIACCSLNDKDIRFYKIQQLFGFSNIRNQPDNMKIKEIINLLDYFKLSLDNGGIFDDGFEKVGKSIKNYMALSEIKLLYPTKLTEFLEKKSKKLRIK